MIEYRSVDQVRSQVDAALLAQCINDLEFNDNEIPLHAWIPTLTCPTPTSPHTHADCPRQHPEPDYPTPSV